MPTLEDHLKRARTLPAARIVPDLLKLLKRPNLESSQVVRLIASDATLASGVLRLCNSARLGAMTPTDDLEEAVTRAGFQEIYQMAASSGGARLLGAGQPAYGIAPGALWRHSFVAATAAQLMARELAEDENAAFTAALFHDVGKVVLEPALVDAGAKLTTESLPGVSVVEAEKKWLAIDHGEMGGQLLQRWNFPDNIVSAVWFHHFPSGARGNQRLAALVYLGNMVASLMGHGSGPLAFALRGRSEVFSVLRITPASLREYMLATFEQLGAPDAVAALAATS